MVYDPVSEQSGVILNIGFEFPYVVAVHIMFESGIYHYIKGLGDFADRLEVMEEEVDLSQFVGLDDPYEKVISCMRKRRKKYQEDRCIRSVSGVAAPKNTHEEQNETANRNDRTPEKDLR